MSNRPVIPANLKRKVLVEAGHRCAIPTCRQTTTEIAHIRPYHKVKKHEYSNLIALCPTCHTRFDRKEIDRKSMRIYKRRVAFLSDRYSRYELNALDYLSTKKRAIVPGCLIVKNLLDDGLIERYEETTLQAFADGDEELSFFPIVLTQSGRDFLDAWQDPSNKKFTY
jgi:HNH endonuclease